MNLINTFPEIEEFRVSQDLLTSLNLYNLPELGRPYVSCAVGNYSTRLINLLMVVSVLPKVF